MRLRSSDAWVAELARTAARPRGSLLLVLINNRDLCADALFIRTQITVGARSAQGFATTSGTSSDRCQLYLF
jgi:hypothetical protein